MHVAAVNPTCTDVPVRAFGTFTPAGQPYWNRGGWLVGFVLFFILGWATFGFVIQGGR